MADWNETLGAGRLIVYSRAPYFRSLLHGLVPVELSIGTMAVTDTGLLLIDPEFAKRVNAEQMAGLLVHEILHVTCGHVTKARAVGRDKRYLGVAQDLAINPAVRDMGFQLPTGELEGVFPETPTYPRSEGFVRGLTQDEYYELLMKQQPKQQGQGKGAGKGAGGAGGKGAPDKANSQSGEGGEGGDADHDHEGDGAGGDPRLPQKPGVGKGWCGSCSAREVPGEPEGKDATEAGARAEQEMQRMLRATAEAVKEYAQSQTGRGSMPAMLTRWADDMTKPPVIPWHVKLRRAQLAATAWQAGAVDHRYDGPSRRQAGLGFGVGAPILPRLRAPKPIIDVVGDTSGSMSAKEIGNVCRETMGIVKQCGATVRFAACDASCNGIKKVTSADELAAALTGGGGTDMRPAFDELMKQTPRPKVIVCITDGCVGDGFPTRPPPGVKVIIVIVGPHGTRIPNTEWAETIVVPPGADVLEESAA